MKPPDTPRTNAASFHRDNGMHRDHDLVVTDEFARDLERELNELAGYLCRVKLPLPVKLIAELAVAFPGKNVRMKDEDGFLCLFLHNT